MINWCSYRNLPCAVVLTKADKLKRGPAQATLMQVRKQLPAVASALTFSSTKGQGKVELIKLLNEWYEMDNRGADSRGSDDHDMIDAQNTGTAP